MVIRIILALACVLFPLSGVEPTRAADLSHLRAAALPPHQQAVTADDFFVHTYGAHTITLDPNEGLVTWEGSDQANPGGFLTHNRAITGPVTLSTRLSLDVGSPRGFGARGKDEHLVWLAGLSLRPDEPPTALALALHISNDGFFGPHGRFRIESAEGLIPSGFVSETYDVARVAQSIDVLLLPLGPPFSSDATYEVAFSYDPVSGLTSISVGNREDDARYETHLYLNPFGAPLFPGVGGLRTSSEEGEPWSLRLDRFSVAEQMSRAGDPLPLRNAKLVVRDSADVKEAVALTSRYSDLPLWLFIDGVKQALPGELSLLAATGSKPTVELWRGPVQEHIVVPVEAGKLPPGVYEIALEYVEPGYRTRVAHREFRILQGRLNATLELEHNQPWISEGAMQATLYLEADRDLQGVRPEISIRPEDGSRIDQVVFSETLNLDRNERVAISLEFEANNPDLPQTFTLKETSGQVDLHFQVNEPPRVRYLSPEGSDDAAGVSPESAWRTFKHAIPKLAPGDTLVLMNGVYERENSGLVDINCTWEWSAQNGKPGAPITVKAFAERQAWIKGDGVTDTIQVRHCRYWNFDGLRISSADNPDATAGNGRPIHIDHSEDIVLRRLLVHHNNRYTNSNHIYINLSQTLLVEETEFYYFHRNGITAHLSDGVTIRRSYGNSRGHGDIPSGYSSGLRDGGDRTFVGYFASNFLVENSVSEGRNLGFGQIAGNPTVTGQPSGTNNRFLGVISIGDDQTGRVQSRKLNPGSEPIRNAYYKDFLMVNSATTGYAIRTARNMIMENVTAIGLGGPAVSSALLDGDEVNFSCEEIGGCLIRFSNWLVLNSYSAINQLDGRPGIFFEYSNFWNNKAGTGVRGALDADTGPLRRSMSVEPIGMGLEHRQCIVYVPEDSNMKGAGTDGEDIGANILYRYVDGELTDVPLWDPISGAFPHGAIVEGINDVPGSSLFDLHTRLNVNVNGCTLPYSR